MKHTNYARHIGTKIPKARSKTPRTPDTGHHTAEFQWLTKPNGKTVFFSGPTPPFDDLSQWAFYALPTGENRESFQGNLVGEARKDILDTGAPSAGD